VSFVTAGEIRDLSGNITVPQYGSVVNVSTLRYDGRPGYYQQSWLSYNNTSDLGALSITHNCQHPSNILVAQWQMQIETDNNVVFKVLKDGSWIDNSFGDSTNASAASDEWYWKGLLCAYHDADNSSTPSNYLLQYVGYAGKIGDIVLTPTWQFTSGSGNLYINRTFGSAGQDGHEICVSTGVCWEITNQGGIS
jgi:hypothetical protein